MYKFDQPVEFYSWDGSSWTLEYTYTGTLSMTSGALNSITIPTPFTTNMLRIETGTVSGSSVVAVGEVKIYGVFVPTETLISNNTILNSGSSTSGTYTFGTETFARKATLNNGDNVYGGSESYTLQDFDEEEAFDNILGNINGGNNFAYYNPPWKLGYEFSGGATYTITRVDLHQQTSYLPTFNFDQPVEFYSWNGSSWTLEYTYTGTIAQTTGAQNSITIPTPFTTNMLRIETGTASGSPVTSVAEVKIYGYLQPGPAFYRPPSDGTMTINSQSPTTANFTIGGATNGNGTYNVSGSSGHGADASSYVNLFDTDTSTRYVGWRGTIGNSMTFYIDMPESFVATKYQIWMIPNDSNTSYYPNSLTLYGRADETSSWTSLTTDNPGFVAGTNESPEITFSNFNSYQYYKVQARNSHPDYIIISDFKIFG